MHFMFQRRCDSVACQPQNVHPHILYTSFAPGAKWDYKNLFAQYQAKIGESQASIDRKRTKIAALEGREIEQTMVDKRIK